MPSENPKALSGFNGRRNIRLLMVDGDAEFTRQMAEHLAMRGYLVETAHNGREGLGLFRTGNFPVVLADLHSPDLNGVELLRNIKRADSSVAVVLTVGPGENRSVAMPAADGCAYDLIEKPMAPDKLAAILYRAVERHRLARRAALSRRLTFALVSSIPFLAAAGALITRKLGY